MKKNQLTVKYLIAPVKANPPLNGTCLNDKNFVQYMNSIKQPEHQDKVYFFVLETYFKVYGNQLK